MDESIHRKCDATIVKLGKERDKCKSDYEFMVRVCQRVEPERDAYRALLISLHLHLQDVRDWLANPRCTAHGEPDPREFHVNYVEKMLKSIEETTDPKVR